MTVDDPEWLSTKRDRPSSEYHGQQSYDYFIILPGDPIKSLWDVVITILIVFVCITAPWRLAFTDEDDIPWTVVGACVDFFFLVDLVINFFTAYHDDEFNLIDDRKVIESLNF